MKVGKKLIGVVLSAAIVFSGMPTGIVMAEEVYSETETDIETIEETVEETTEFTDSKTETETSEDVAEGENPADTAFAEEQESIQDEQTEQIANSWRYTDGEWNAVRGGIASKARAQTYPYAWQEVDGQYMNSRGEVVEGVIARGIDVSVHQGTIDWDKVKADGVDFAIIRCGYGKNATNQDDAQFARNVKECIRLGIPFGIYLYSYAMDKASAKDEAEHVLRVLKENGISGSDLSYPVFYDMENEGGSWNQASLSASALGDVAQTFCDTISAAGYEVGIYANTNWFTNYLTDKRFQQWDKWVAQYNYQCTYAGNYQMWQCTSEGTVDGISEKVDINFDFYYANKNGLVVKDGKTYFYENGVMAKSKEAVVNGQWKWFDADGVMAVSKDVYLASANKWVRYNAEGDMVKGWDTNANGTYYFDPITGAMCKGVTRVEGKYYYFYQITGVMVVAKSKELVVDGEWRWFDADGTVAVSKDVYLSAGSKWVRYNSDGAMVKGWDTNAKGTYYFDLTTGEMLKGWHWLSGRLYYFNPVTGIRQ